MTTRADPIVVTGMGAWGAAGTSASATYASALTGRSTARWQDLHWPGGSARTAVCRAEDPRSDDPAMRPARRLDRAALMGLSAAHEAWSDAAVGEDPGLDMARVGVFTGMSRGPIAKGLETAEALAAGRLRPSSGAEATLASVNGVISQSLGLRGPSMSVVATCTSAANAIGVAALHLLNGDVDVAICGGVEAPLVPLICAQLEAAGVAGHDDDPERTCRPFDVHRNGLVLGEGAAFLVLERASNARARGKSPYATLAGWASGVDLAGRTAVTPQGDGVVQVVRRAMEVAELAPVDIGYVNAHGTGTQMNDAVEAVALNRFFGSGRVPPTSSTKPVTGHCLGATPALEAIIAIQAMRNGCLPPTANLTDPDPQCDLDLIREPRRAAGVGAVLSTSLGFWGMQAALVFTTP